MPQTVVPQITLTVRERERLDDLLAKSSRTFALTIPLLPEPTRLEVTLAYLLFRVADTLEDATHWGHEHKVSELSALAGLLERPDVATAVALAERWRLQPPLEHAGYRELLEELPFVLRARHAIDAHSWEIIVRHTVRTVQGMSMFVTRAAGGPLRLRDVDDLRTYCYTVAGIVGEMLTELFLLGRKQLASVARELRADASAFGEGL
jgi:farnesyl-diphosphate farnesyltransferase